MKGASDAPYHGVYFELMRVTITIAQAFKLSPFDLFKQDKDEVILIINYFIEAGEDVKETRPLKAEKKETRIRVNDETASGGWY